MEPLSAGGDMKFEMVKGLDEEKFRRLTGIKRKTFDVSAHKVCGESFFQINHPI